MRGRHQPPERPSFIQHVQTSGTIMKIKSGLLIGMALPCMLAAAHAQADTAGGSSNAAHAGGGKVIIRGFEMRKDGAIFESSDPDQSQPTCVKRSKWSLSLKTKKQQILFGRLLAAAGTGVPVSVRGTGKCLSVKDAETISSVDGTDDADALTSTSFSDNGSSQ
jgi:hypothetical protein